MKPVVTRRPQQGFTLLELMVTLAIVGILAMLGPRNTRTTSPARVSEGFNLAEPYKLAVTEQISSNNGVFTVAQPGLPAFTPTDNVSKIEVSPMEKRGVGGVITITYSPRVGDGGTLTLTPTITSGTIQWQCAAKEVKQAATPEGATANTGFVAGTLPAKFAPANAAADRWLQQRMQHEKRALGRVFSFVHLSCPQRIRRSLLPYGRAMLMSLLPPRFSVTQISVMTMVLSTALLMS
jgi:type IV pilus assembly protein PilA